MDPIRVMLAEMVPVARIAVRQSLAACEQVDIVADAAIAGVELLVHVRRLTPDVVLLGVGSDGMPPICSHLLAEFPHLKILGVDDEGCCHSVYENVPCARRVTAVDSQRTSDAVLQVLAGW